MKKEPYGPVAQWIERRFPKPCVGGSNPLGAAIYIRFVRVEIAEPLDMTAFVVIFHFLGIPKKTIESEKILHEFCTAIWHGTAPPLRDRPAGILFVPSHLKCASTFVKWLQYLYAPAAGKRI